MYVAGKTIKVQVEGGGLEVRLKGDPVPEALTWRYIHKHIGRGTIRLAEPGSVPSSVVSMVKCTDCDRTFKTEIGMKRHRGVKHRKV